MEKSIKRVEKLVHATNSALAQMKFSLMFDDISGGKNSQAGKTGESFDVTLLEKFLNADDLNLPQKEFMLEASETLAKLEKISAPNEVSRKNLKPLDKIKEINRKMNQLKLKHSKRGETKQSRQKLLSLISEEKFSPGKSSCKGSVESKQTAPFKEEKEPSEKFHPTSTKKVESASSATRSPVKSEAELKIKILETQEIVDRGFQTARQLAQKVESMTKWDKKDRTPSTGKTVSEMNLKSSEGKTESNESMKTINCRRHSGKSKRRERGFREVEQINTRVIDVKRKEFERSARANLQLQHLPSLHIRPGLKVQKIHNLEIPASEEVRSEKSNTAISFLSHEQMEREKMEKLLEKVRKENCGCLEDQSRTNYVECFNCGKLIKVRATWVDPRKIDEVLRRCDFNVFDPRIDEFVEKCGGADATNLHEETRPMDVIQSEAVAPAEHEAKPKDTEDLPRTEIKEEPKKARRFTLQDLSDQLCKKYREEADALTDNHQKLDSVLQNLFRKVEESREVFDTCHLLRNYKSKSEEGPTLTATKPVLVNLPGISSFVKNTQNKLDKKDIKNRSKSRTRFLNEKNKNVSLPAPPPSESPKPTEKTKEKVLSFTHANRNKSSQSKAKEEARSRFFASPTRENRTTKHQEITKEESEQLFFVASPPSSSSSSPHKAEASSREKKFKKTLIMASVNKKNTKLPENKPTNKNNVARPLENKKEKTDEVKVPSMTSSASSTPRRKTVQTDFEVKSGEELKDLSASPIQLHSSPILTKKETERKAFVTSSRESSNTDKDEEEKAESCQTLPEKSENNYESDFESFTNETEEKRNECEDEKPETNPIFTKLSTISEVDSELEKRPSNDKDSLCYERERKVGSVREKESSSLASGISGKSKKTEVTSVKTAEVSQKSPPTELVTSLKDILSALQVQFARTESLAEKLTENSKFEKKENTELVTKTTLADVTLDPWGTTTAVKLVENLQNSRKDWSSSSKPRSLRRKVPEEILSLEGASEEGGSSLGEIIVSEEGRNNSGTSSTSSISEESILNMVSSDKSLLISSGRKEVVGTFELR